MTVRSFYKIIINFILRRKNTKVVSITKDNLKILNNKLKIFLRKELPWYKLFYKDKLVESEKIIEVEKEEKPESEKKLETKSLHDLFLNDFNKTHMIGDYHLTKNDKVVYSVKYNIWGDFESKTLFFSIFLPESDYTFEACRFLIPIYREILNGDIRSLMKAMIHQTPGSKPESWDELSFSGRIYLYHETHLLPDRIDTLTEEYNNSDLHPQFRGRDYLIMKNSPLYGE